MTFRLTTAVLGLMLSSSVFAAATLTTPEEIVILAVNDQEVNSGLFRGTKNMFKVDSGENSLSVRYQGYFGHNDGEHDILKSGVITLKTPALQDNQTYRLALINAPQEFEAAKNMPNNRPLVCITVPINCLFSKQVPIHNLSLG